MKKLVISFAVSLCLAYGWHRCSENLFVSNWKCELYESEIRILRDEIRELQSKPTYEQGVAFTLIRTKFQDGFSDGALEAYKSLDANFDYVSLYHKVMESISANTQIAEKNRQKELHDAYERGISDATNSQSHPDYTPRVIKVKE